VVEKPEVRTWLVLLARMPTEPARHRMALWRELRRCGAVPLGQAAWALPQLPAVHAVVDRLTGIAVAGGGSLLVLGAHGYRGDDVDRLEQLYADTREEEWAEFRSDCGKYLAELDREEANAKYTLAELEEEEQSLDRLRRWYRDLRGRDLLNSPPAHDAGIDLKECEERFNGYAEGVYTALGTYPAPGPGPSPRRGR